MIKQALAAKPNDVSDFIEERLVLLLSERKLRQGKVPLQGAAFSLGALKNIDDTIFLHRRDERATDGVIVTTEERSNRLRAEPFGFAIRKNASGDAEVFIDTYREAIKKGIVRAPKRTMTRQLVAAAVIAALIVGFVVFAPVAIFMLFIVVIGYPIIYLFQKRQFSRTQAKMRTITDIFAAEFPERGRTDSKDWLSFWGRIKSEAPDLFADLARSL